MDLCWLVCKIVDQNGDDTYLTTSDLSLTDYETFINHWNHRWDIEEFHRGIKQTTGIEKCYSTLAPSQKTHIFAAFSAFIKLETNRLKIISAGMNKKRKFLDQLQLVIFFAQVRKS